MHFVYTCHILIFIIIRHTKWSQCPIILDSCYCESSCSDSTVVDLFHLPSIMSYHSTSLPFNTMALCSVDIPIWDLVQYVRYLSFYRCLQKFWKNTWMTCLSCCCTHGLLVTSPSPQPSRSCVRAWTSTTSSCWNNRNAIITIINLTNQSDLLRTTLPWLTFQRLIMFKPISLTLIMSWKKVPHMNRSVYQAILLSRVIDLIGGDGLITWHSAWQSPITHITRVTTRATCISCGKLFQTKVAT